MKSWRVPDTKRIQQCMVYVHVPAQFPGIAQVMDRRKAYPFDRIQDRINDLRVSVF